MPIEKNINNVKIISKRTCHLTSYLSAHYKTYCFAFQKRLFCKVKEPLLVGKTYAFATSKRSCHFLRILSLQNRGYFSAYYLKRKGNSTPPVIIN